ncbi:MAG: hypothetical protein RBT02_04105 [Bacteroidales bacterium]|jgi:hypothetical protein|nr:hypothetical protein [Bacteroidales bacterium]
MKRLIILLALVLFAAAGCKEKKPADYTRLGFFTQYQTYMEKLNGKIESVTEKGYWAIPEGDTYIKGAMITKKELDSIGYTYDFKAIFDADGDLVSSTTYDENDKVIDTWHLAKVNGLLARSEYISADTVRYKQVITCDEEGNPVLYEGYNALADTLTQKIEVGGSFFNDTITVQYFNYKGDPGTKILMMFNSLGLLTQVEYYGKDGTPGYSYNYVYNDKGFQSEFTGFDKDKVLATKTSTTYEYDEKGNWIKGIVKDQRDFTIICERVYNYFE